MASYNGLNQLLPVLLQDLTDLDDWSLWVRSKGTLSTKIAISGLFVSAFCYEADNSAKFNHS